MTKNYIKKINELPVWRGKINIKSLDGGITNENFLVTDDSQKLVVRLGEDILEHHVLRSNELIATKAAFEAGIGPEVIYNEKGVLIIKYIESKTMSANDVSENIDAIIPLIKKIHYEIPKKLFGPAMIFWVFHVVRNYAKFLEDNNSPHKNILNKLIDSNSILENISSPHEIVFSHNDLLPANFLDDGSKIWLIDWEYAGFNSPLFDLGGIASNNNFSIQEENYLLEKYYNKKIEQNLLKQYKAMKCASLLRETMWSMVSEITSKIEFDYANYTKENLDKFEKSFSEFK
tara:strand:- start:354 stop:1220 length:867 start_codon:yes stop_codon:yes gene_type:complete